ncbi:hypothetical protein CGA21_13190, partial [Pseudomonas sp. PSB11]|nr:hypothetical protein [Pseudomonas sp. PSB11]
PQGVGAALKRGDDADPMWERACSRRGHHIQHQGRLTHRFREQARSHRGSGLHSKWATMQIQCGSEPAREEAITPRIKVA